MKLLNGNPQIGKRGIDQIKLDRWDLKYYGTNGDDGRGLTIKDSLNLI
jgi:hypothetical protein